METELALSGASRDRCEQTKWHTDQGPLSVSGQPFMNCHRDAHHSCFFLSNRSHEAIPSIISIAHVSIILTALKHFRLGTHGALVSSLQLPKPKDDDEANAASHKPVSSFRLQVAAGSHR